MQMLKAKAKQKKRTGRARKGEGSLKLRGNTYWYVIPGRTPGTKIERSCGTGDMQEALTIKAQALIDSRKAEPTGTDSALVSDVLDDYAKFCEREKRRSWRSLKCAIKTLDRLVGSVKLADLTTAVTDLYRDRRLSDGVQDSTVNRELGYFAAALRREMHATPSRVTSVPFIRTTSEKDCVRSGFIDRDNGYRAILEALPSCLRAIFVCAFHTGARRGELKAITWEQVNFEQGVIELTPKTTKNREGRWIPIWGDMREHLLRQKEIRDSELPECPWVFFWPAGHHARAVPGEQQKDFRFLWKQSCIAAGFPNLLFHDLRRSAIRFADQEAKMSSSRVRAMSGHKTDAVYTRYNIVGGKDIQSLGKELDAYLTAREGKKVVPIRRRA